MRSVSILVVDDFELWRRAISSLVQKRSDWVVVAEASDGLEAVQKSAEMQPDLVLLDVGLPKLNGLEAAERILRVAPNAKILFVSQEPASTVVEEALSVGAMGYIQKARAHRDLLPAIEGVLAGRCFVSGSQEFRESSEAALLPSPHCHEVIFYSHDTGFFEGLSDFIAATLKSDRTAIVVATAPHREALVQRLKAESLDIDRAIQERSYIALDSIEALESMMVNGVPDRARLFETAGGLIDSIKAKRPGEHGITSCGECAPLLLAKGEVETAIRVEQLWEELRKTYGIDLMCAYPMSSFPGGQEDPVFKMICAEHTAVHFR